MPRPPSGLTLRRRLVEKLAATGTLTDQAVRRAFLAVPRERFLPSTGLAEVYADKAVVTRTDTQGAPTSSSSQPGIMAIMLEHLEPAPGLRVLEIGAGTGYNAALLSTLVGPTGHVTSVEVQPDLAAAAAEALDGAGYRVEVVAGDGRDGWPAGAPYDRIVLTASTPAVCRPWFDQLAPGGLLQLPLHLKGFDVQAVVTLRKEGGVLRSAHAADGGFMVLRAPDATPLGGARGSSISLGEHVGGRHRSFGSLTGDDLRRLTPAARRRVAGLLLGEPRARRLGARSPGLWLLLSRPPRAVVARYFRSGRSIGVAVAATDGRSVAVATGARAESYGEPAAEQTLAALLAEWRGAGRPRTEDLDVTVAFPPAGGEPGMTVGWRQPSIVSSRR